MKHLPVVFTFIFILGIWFGTFIDVSFPVLLISAIISAIACFVTIRREKYFLIFSVIFIYILGAAHLKNFQTNSRSDIVSCFPHGIPGLCSLKGYVANEPVHKNARTTFLLRAEEVESDNWKRPCSGEVLISMRGNREIPYLERVILSGHLSRFFPYRPFNQKSRLFRQERRLIMRVDFPYQLKKLGRKSGFSIQALALGIKSGIEEVIFKYLPPVPAGIVDAMLLGEERNIPPLVYDVMIKTGTVHILVVSGFNVGILTFTAMLLLKVMRIPRTVRICSALPLVILYCFMTGASPPVVRATVMAVVFLAACLLVREADIYNALAAAALFILLINPTQLFGISFQLSFASVIALAWLYPKISAAVSLKQLKIRVFRFIADSFLVSVSAWLGTMGLIGCYFRMVSPVTVFANIVIVPLASFITLCGVCMVALHYVFPPLAFTVAATCEWAIGLLMGINSVLVRIPGAYFKF